MRGFPLIQDGKTVLYGVECRFVGTAVPGGPGYRFFLDRPEAGPYGPSVAGGRLPPLLGDCAFPFPGRGGYQPPVCGHHRSAYVFVNAPTRGYGIFIENLPDAAGQGNSVSN